MEKRISENRLSYLEEGKEVAYVLFHKTAEDRILITKTFVDDSKRGCGLAVKLMEDILLLAEKEDCRICATCSYAEHYFTKKGEKRFLPLDTPEEQQL